MTTETMELGGGNYIPVIGFGTDLEDKSIIEKSLRCALDAGYTHIDTAEGYLNEEYIGKVLNDYKRKDIFLTSKILPSNLNYENVLAACERSLDKLNTDYLDLYMIHWPNPAISLRETLYAMKTLKEHGFIKNVGVSNFSKYQLNIALKISPVQISVNQFEFHPYQHNIELVEFCKNKGVAIEASAPLARTEVLEDQFIKNLANKYNKTPAQIVLRWEKEKGIIPLPKSSSEEHIKSNLNIFNWKLNDEDVQKIDQIEEEKKVYSLNINDRVFKISK